MVLVYDKKLWQDKNSLVLKKTSSFCVLKPVEVDSNLSSSKTIDDNISFNSFITHILPYLSLCLYFLVTFVF